MTPNFEGDASWIGLAISSKPDSCRNVRLVAHGILQFAVTLHQE